MLLVIELAFLRKELVLLGVELALLRNELAFLRNELWLRLLQRNCLGLQRDRLRLADAQLIKRKGEILGIGCFRRSRRSALFRIGEADCGGAQGAPGRKRGGKGRYRRHSVRRGVRVAEIWRSFTRLRAAAKEGAGRLSAGQPGGGRDRLPPLSKVVESFSSFIVPK